MNNSNTLLPTLDGISNLVLDNIETNSLIVDTNAQIIGDLTVSGTSILNNVSASKLNQAVLNYDISNNLSLGDTTTFQNRGGINNVIMGYKAMGSGLTSSNTAIGSFAGGIYAQDGDFNTYIGAYSDTDGLASYTQSTAIGANSRITASNQIKLGTVSETVNIDGNLTANFGNIASLRTGFIYCDNFSSIGNLNVINFVSGIQAESGIDTSSIICSGNIIANIVSSNTFLTKRGKIYDDGDLNLNIEGVGADRSIKLLDNVKINETLDVSGQINIGNTNCIWWDSVGSSTYIQGYNDNTIFYCSKNVHQFNINGNQIGYFNSSGLTINSGSIKSQSDLRLQPAGGSNVIVSTGNVGIGRTSPAYALDVSGSARLNSILYLNSSRLVNTNNIIFTNNTNAYSVQQIDNAGANFFRLGRNGYSDIVINSSGYVGIGTSAPTYSFDVNGSIHSNTHLYFGIGQCYVDSVNISFRNNNTGGSSFLQTYAGSVGNYHSAYLDPNGYFVVENLQSSGTIALAYTTLPTFTNKQLGYSQIDAPAGSTTLSATSTWYSLYSVSLPVGVWSFNWRAFASSFTGGIFIRTAVSLFPTSYFQGTLLCNSYIVYTGLGSGLINGSGTCSLTATTTVNLIAATSSPSPIIEFVELQYTRIG